MIREFTGPGAVLAALVLLLAPSAALRAEIRVEGRLTDRSDGAPVADARIIALEAGTDAYSSADGSFALTLPEPGNYTFRIIVQGELEQIRRPVRFDGEVLDLQIGEASVPQEVREASDGDGITVVGRRDQTKLSRFRLSQDEIKRLPGAYGDSLKAIETLPGVAPAPPVGAAPSSNLLTNSFIRSLTGGVGLGEPYTNSVSGVLAIRGSGARASRFYLDGFQVQYPFHLGDQSSVVHNDYVRAVDVYTGTYPTRFGNATGGIISIEGPRADEIESPLTNLNVSLFKTDVYHHRPLISPDAAENTANPLRISVVATARQSYPNYVLLQAYPDAIPDDARFANYQDGQFKIGMHYGRMHELYLIYFGASDLLDYTQEAAELAGNSSSAGSTGGSEGGFGGGQDTRPPVGLDRDFHTQGLNYNLSYGGVLRNELFIQTSRFREDFDLDFRSPLTGETLFGYEVLDARREFSVRDELQYALPGLEKHALLRTGVEVIDFRWELGLRNIAEAQTVNPNSPDFLDIINDLIENNRSFRALFDGDRTEFQLHAYWAELELEYGRVRLTPGVRTEWYSLANSTGVGPRMGAEFAIPETGTTLLAGAGRHFNVPPGLQYVSEEAGNPWLGLEESDHIAGGLEQEIGREWLLKVELFRNTFRNLVVEDEFLEVPFSPRTNRRDLVNNQAEIPGNPIESRPLGYSNDGTGFAEGFEIFLKKTRPPGRTGFFGWLSYTNSLAKRNNHQPRLTDAEREERNARNLNRNLLAYYEFDSLIFRYYDTGELETLYDNDREELYDLDRTHQANLVLNYKFSDGWQIGLRWRYATNTPYTPIVGAESTANLPIIGRPTFLPEYSERFNSARLRPFHQLDIRIDRFLNYDWGYVNYYLEIINAYARRNEETVNFDFLYPYYPPYNPAVQYESTFIATPSGGGRQLLLPLINLGVEVRF